MAGVPRQYPLLENPFTGDLLFGRMRAILPGREPGDPEAMSPVPDRATRCELRL